MYSQTLTINGQLFQAVASVYDQSLVILDSAATCWPDGVKHLIQECKNVMLKK